MSAFGKSCVKPRAHNPLSEESLPSLGPDGAPVLGAVLDEKASGASLLTSVPLVSLNREEMLQTVTAQSDAAVATASGAQAVDAAVGQAIAHSESNISVIELSTTSGPSEDSQSQIVVRDGADLIIATAVMTAPAAAAVALPPVPAPVRVPAPAAAHVAAGKTAKKAASSLSSREKDMLTSYLYANRVPREPVHSYALPHASQLRLDIAILRQTLEDAGAPFDHKVGEDCIEKWVRSDEFVTIVNEAVSRSPLRVARSWAELHALGTNRYGVVFAEEDMLGSLCTILKTNWTARVEVSLMNKFGKHLGDVADKSIKQLVRVEDLSPTLQSAYGRRLTRLLAGDDASHVDAVVLLAHIQLAHYILVKSA